MHARDSASLLGDLASERNRENEKAREREREREIERQREKERERGRRSMQCFARELERVRER